LQFNRSSRDQSNRSSSEQADYIDCLKANLSRIKIKIERSRILKLIDKAILIQSIKDMINRKGLSRIIDLQMGGINADEKTIERHRKRLIDAQLLEKERGPMKGRRYLKPGKLLKTFIEEGGRFYDKDGREIASLKVFYAKNDSDRPTENCKQAKSEDNDAFLQGNLPRRSENGLIQGNLPRYSNRRLEDDQEEPIGSSCSASGDQQQFANNSTFATHSQERYERLMSDYTEEAGALFEIWNDPDCILKKVKVTDLDRFHEAMQAIQTALSQRIKAEEIAESMIKYNRLWSLDHLRLNRKAASHFVTLPNFFKFSQFVKLEAGSLIADIGCWRAECEKPFNELMSKYVYGIRSDKHPKVSKALRRAWDASVYKQHNLMTKEEGHIRESAEKLVEWVRVHKKELTELDPIFIEEPERIAATFMMPAIKHELRGRSPLLVSTLWLAHGDMFERRLPIYLQHIGKMERYRDPGDEEE
jgi:hypothetical protein